MAFVDATSAFPGLANASLIISCGGVVWAAASIKTGVAKDLAAIRKQLDTMVTHDAMELRLSQERNVSDGKVKTSAGGGAGGIFTAQYKPPRTVGVNVGTDF